MTMTRIRAAVTGLLATAAVVGGVASSAASASAATSGPVWSTAAALPATAAALPTVDMEATVLAAQIDPRRADHTLTPGARVPRDGYVVDARTQAMLTEAERVLGFRLVLEQGSYNPGGDPTSAGTHDGGGVVDVAVTGMSAATRTAVARALRQVGFAPGSVTRARATGRGTSTPRRSATPTCPARPSTRPVTTTSA
ncbi:hypothetical protein ACNTMW_26340 [Planosporangium sp. 12N6]|uniref:hypothetical protein n=1 Tax=Planosporangium spinosum TaxID=3402278 RepID=UPI003CF607C2